MNDVFQLAVLLFIFLVTFAFAGIIAAMMQLGLLIYLERRARQLQAQRHAREEYTHVHLP